MFYKLVDGKNIIGVVISSDFRKLQPRHGLILFSNEENGQFVQYKDKYYRDDWLRNIPDDSIEVINIDIVAIDENEYNELKASLDQGNIPEDDSLEEEIIIEQPQEEIEEAETVVKTAAQILNEQIKLAARFAEV